MRSRTRWFSAAWTRRLCGAALTTAFVLGSVSPAFAGAADRYLQQIEQYREQLQTHAKRDIDKMAAEDINNIAAWLDEAERAIKQNQLSVARRRIKRAEYGLQLVAELVHASEISGRAKQQQATNKSAKEQIVKMEGEIKKLKAKKAELEQQLKQLGQ